MRKYMQRGVRNHVDGPHSFDGQSSVHCSDSKPDIPSNLSWNLFLQLRPSRLL